MARRTIAKVESKGLRRLPTQELQRKQRAYLDALGRVVRLARYQAQNLPTDYFKETYRVLSDTVDALVEVDRVLRERTDIKAGPLAVA